jgi:hypothetical protein
MKRKLQCKRSEKLITATPTKNYLAVIPEITLRRYISVIKERISTGFDVPTPLLSHLTLYNI